MKITSQPHDYDLVDLRVKWLNDPDVNQYLGSDSTTHKKQETWFKQYEKDSTKRFFTIMADDKPIGVVGLMNISQEKKNAEVFVMIGETEYHGRGFGVEAIKHIRQYAVDELGLTSLYLSVHKKNQVAIHAYQAAGFGFDPAKDDAEWLAMIWLKT